MTDFRQSVTDYANEYYRLIRHIEITSEYGINRGRNLWTDSYYVNQLHKMEWVLRWLKFF